MVFETFIFGLVTYFSYKRAFLIHFLYKYTCNKVFYDQDLVFLSNIYLRTFYREKKHNRKCLHKVSYVNL